MYYPTADLPSPQTFPTAGGGGSMAAGEGHVKKYYRKAEHRFCLRLRLTLCRFEYNGVEKKSTATLLRYGLHSCESK
uniref:Uncharacterized protein n=1 Tax=Anopheles merus TaxID=30066 RepID=A0A182UX30_ANOME